METQNPDIKNHYLTKEKYFTNDLRFEIKKLKGSRHKDVKQLYQKLEHLNEKIHTLNDRVEHLNDKLTTIRNDVQGKLERLQLRVKKVHKRLILTVTVFTILAITLLILNFWVLND